MDPASRDWRIGYRRLVTAPHDLKRCGARVWKASRKLQGSPAHRRLFAEYREEIKRAVEASMKWWDGMIAHQSRRIGDREQVIRDAWELRPAGPASYPDFVSVIRKYWLACDALNRECKEGERVSPEVFLLTWLVEAGEEEAVKVITYMPYWPIGLDHDGNWV
jgi:hypothetical protein